MRLIDADAVERYISKGLNGLKHRSKAFGHDAVRILTHIHYMPTVDAVHVVRCEDCCHSYDDIGGLVCSYGACCIVPEDFYCKHGERTIEGDK